MINEVRLAQSFYLAERLGGVFYDKFSANVDNNDVANAFHVFAGHEHEHARWYADWLKARGAEVPSTQPYEYTLIPGLRAVTAAQPLALKLRTFAATEAAAEQHLRFLLKHIRDRELKSIVEKTIPFEHMHSRWYRDEGERMLKKRDR